METIQDKTPEKRARFERDLLTAAAHPEYDNSTLEHDIREALAWQEYQKRLKKNADRQRKFGNVRPATKQKMKATTGKVQELGQTAGAPEYLKEGRTELSPCSEEVFWKILLEDGIRFTTNFRQTTCPIHEEGPKHERELEKAYALETKLMARQENATDHLDTENRREQPDAEAIKRSTERVQQTAKDLRTVLNTRIDLEAKVEKYKKHKNQFETCRKRVNKIMENLGPGECLVYRDFVNQHSWYDNQKICNLVLVVIWKENGSLRSIKLNNFCSDEDSQSTDPYYVRDVLDFHLRQKNILTGHTGLLHQFKKIYISGSSAPAHRKRLTYLLGDHGSHFSSIKTVYNESCMFDEYGVDVHIVSLPSYHCFNRSTDHMTH